MINYLDYYNQSYSKFTPGYLEENFDDVIKFSQENSDTIIKFINQYRSQFPQVFNNRDLKILDLGAGLGGVSCFLAKEGYEVSALDISPMAISLLDEISQKLNLEIETFCHNVSEPGINLNKKFDVIIDSHLLHCIISDDDRNNYYSFVKNHLSDEGIFLLETMAYHSKIQFPVGYEFSEEHVLYKDLNDERIPIRRILESINIEDEIKLSGLDIHYLYYHNELSFHVFTDYPQYPTNYLPKVLRIASSIHQTSS